jgi:hypothetical protein
MSEPLRKQTLPSFQLLGPHPTLTAALKEHTLLSRVLRDPPRHVGQKLRTLVIAPPSRILLRFPSLGVRLLAELSEQPRRLVLRCFPLHRDPRNRSDAAKAPCPAF